MLDSYHKLIESGKIKPDEAQEKLGLRLEQLEEELADYEPGEKGLIGKIIGKKPLKPKGLYIQGKVGRGKSMMMDLFYKGLPTEQKKRSHFHEFMQEVHRKIHHYRQEKMDDPVRQVARELSENAKILCFDEYDVNDVSDAMILTRLFREMSEQGTVFVMTSNKRPEEHYKGGLQRPMYDEFCKYLEKVVEVFSLDAKRDYRLNQKTSEDNFFIPSGYEATQEMKEKFKNISTETLEKRVLNVDGREITIRGAGRIAWADFEELCVKPLGTNDYSALAENFDVLFLENVPKMDDDNFKNAAKRFISLVDIFYDRRILLIASFEVEIDELYQGFTNDAVFARTNSRLKEMRGWKRKPDAELRLD